MSDNNPYSLTPAQLKTILLSVSTSKVDRVTGKQLSTHDFNSQWLTRLANAGVYARQDNNRHAVNGIFALAKDATDEQIRAALTCFETKKVLTADDLIYCAENGSPLWDEATQALVWVTHNGGNLFNLIELSMTNYTELPRLRFASIRFNASTSLWSVTRPGQEERIAYHSERPLLVTSEQDGLMSSADKARLDSLQSYAPATTSADGLLSAEDKQKLTLAGINDNGASFVSGQVDDSTGSLQHGDYVVACVSKGGVDNAITLVRKQLPIPKGISALSYNVLNYTTIQNGDNVCCRVDEDGGCWYAPIRIFADPDGNEFLTASSTLSSSKLSGALPAISGASLTSLNASNLASGTVPSARLPTASASADGKLTSTNYKYLLSSTTATSITSLSTAYRQIVASISASASLAFNTSSAFSAGREIHIIIKNTASADITVTLPNSGIYLTDTDTLTVPAAGYAEVNAISDGSKIYLRSAQ